MFLRRKDESRCVTLGLLSPVMADDPLDLGRVKAKDNFFVMGAHGWCGYNHAAWLPYRLTLGKHV